MFFFFFNDTATTEIYTLSLHDALPIFRMQGVEFDNGDIYVDGHKAASDVRDEKECRSEERFSRNAETDLVCRLLLEKKKAQRPHIDVRKNITHTELLRFDAISHHRYSS